MEESIFLSREGRHRKLKPTAASDQPKFSVVLNCLASEGHQSESQKLHSEGELNRRDRHPSCRDKGAYVIRRDTARSGTSAES